MVDSNSKVSSFRCFMLALFKQTLKGRPFSFNWQLHSVKLSETPCPSRSYSSKKTTSLLKVISVTVLVGSL